MLFRSEDLRLLLKTRNSTFWGDPAFHDDYVGVTENGARYLVDRGVKVVGVDYLSVNVGYDVVPWQKTIKNIGAFITWLEKNADRFTLVRTVADIDAAKREGKLAIAFDIEGMGEKHVEEFWKGGLIKSPVDIFRLDREKAKLSEREGWGERSVEKLLEAIERRRDRDARVLGIDAPAGEDVAVRHEGMLGVAAAQQDLRHLAALAHQDQRQIGRAHV